MAPRISERLVKTLVAATCTAVAGCMAGPLGPGGVTPPSTSATAAPAGGGTTPAPTATPAGTTAAAAGDGRAVVESIPAGTSRIVVTSSPASLPLVTKRISATRGTDQTVTVTLTAIPTGATRLSAVAVDEAGNPLAAGSAAVTIAAGQTAEARITLGSALKPSVRSVWPEVAVPGYEVALYGSGFGNATMSVAVGGAAVASADITVASDEVLKFKVPASATTSVVAAAFGDVVLAGSTPFTTIASVSLSPGSTSSFTPSGLVRFKVDAFDFAGSPIASSGVFPRIAARSCDPSPCTGEDTLSVMDLVAGPDPGSITVTIGSGAVKADATVALHALGRSDLGSFNLGPLGAVPYPAGNEPTDARVSLGRTLFFDVNLSTNSARPTKLAFSCSSCHEPDKGWGDGVALPTGNDSAKLGRNAPTALDSAYQTTNFWDGRAASLEAQALGVIGNPREFASSIPEMVAYVKGKYAAEFQTAYGIASDSIDENYVVKAISSFERKKVVTPPNTAAFDKWAGGDDGALTAGAKRGLGAFMGKAQCVNCHNGPLFSDKKFHNVGIPGSGTSDFGRAAISGLTQDLGAFRTPTLRNIALTGPYFHNGSKATLNDAIKHYTTFDAEFPNLSPQMPKIRVADSDVADLIEFLNSLTATQSHL